MIPKRASIAVGLVLLAVSAAAPAAAAPRPTTRIPFLFRNNHILVQASVGATDSLWFIVDTGASGSVINQSTAKRLGLTVVPGVEAHGAGGPAPGGTVEGATIRLPGLTLDGDRLVALDLDAIATRTGHPCDGVIGRPFWQGSVVEIDYARSELVLHDPGAYRYRGTGTTFPLTFQMGLPYMRAKATLPGGKPIEGRFVLDTGSSLALILAPQVVARHEAQKSMPRTLRVQLGGVGGASMSPLGRIERLELGPYVVLGPLAVLRQSGPGHTNAGDTAGNIGGDILRRFRVIFDYSRERMILEPAAALGEPFEADMSGLVFSVRLDGSKAIDVIIVQEDSPAAEIGIREGDVLETFDGRPVAAPGLVDLRRELRTAGRTVRLGLRRDDVVTERTLVTRRLL